MGSQDDRKEQHDGAGLSAEGVGSALEAMLRRRQMRVDPQPDPAAQPTGQEQERKPLVEE